MSKKKKRNPSSQEARKRKMLGTACIMPEYKLVDFTAINCIGGFILYKIEGRTFYKFFTDVSWIELNGLRINF